MSDIGTFTRDDLKTIPTFRAAYSDRTALLMAKLAHRAYEVFDSDDTAWAKFKDARPTRIFRKRERGAQKPRTRR